MKVVNLSNRPFINERPVKRLTVVLWTLGAVLLAMNIQNYWTYWLDSAEAREKHATIRDRLKKSQSETVDLRQQVEKVNLNAINKKAFFLNQLIERRAFPWSQLFENLEEVLQPHYQIQLQSVQPQREEVKLTGEAPSRRGRSNRSTSKTRVIPKTQEKSRKVDLQLRGVSQSSEAILDFIDTLFAHPAFLDPNLRTESEDPTTRLSSFDISVVYLTHIDDDAEEEVVTAEDGEEIADSSQPDVDNDEEADQENEESGSPAATSRLTQAKPPQASAPSTPATSSRTPPANARSSTSDSRPSASNTTTNTPEREGSTLKRVPAGQPVQQAPATLRPRRLPTPRPEARAGRQSEPRAETSAPSQSASRPVTGTQPDSQPEQRKPNFNSDEASATPRLGGGGS